MKSLISKLTSNFWIPTVFLLLLYIFLKLSMRGLDPDLGWHLRNAKDFLEGGIFPNFDHYSFALNNFPWVVFEFRLELVMYAVYKSFGYFGLGLFFSLITSLLLTLHLYLTVKFFKIRLLTLVIFSGIFLLGFFSSFGIRVPVFAVWMNVLLFWLTWFYLNNKINSGSFSFLAVILLAIWANAHPSFPLGLGILVAAVIYKSLHNKVISYIDVVGIIAATLVTLTNPYGLRLWQEVLGHFSPNSSFMHSYIQEWKSIFLLFPIDFYGVAAFWFVFLMLLEFRRKLLKEHFFQLAVITFFFVSTCLAVRNLPLLIIWSLPPVLTVLNDKVKVKLVVGTKYKNFGYLFLGSLLLVLTLGLVLENTGVDNLVTPPKPYPSKEALTAIKENLPLVPKVYNPYAFGGYLIWNFGGDPKVFIDGRMPATWFQADRFPFKDYAEMSWGDLAKQATFYKYDFNIAIVEKTSWTPLDKINQLILGGPKAEADRGRKIEEKSVRTYLERQPNWKEVFSDDTAKVFIKLT